MKIGKLLFGLASTFLPGVGGAVDIVEAVAREVTGIDDIDEAAEVLKQDPEMMARVQTRLSEERVAVEKEETIRMTEVNKSIRAELTSGDGFQKYWRP